MHGQQNIKTWRKLAILNIKCGPTRGTFVRYPTDHSRKVRRHVVRAQPLWWLFSDVMYVLITWRNGSKRSKEKWTNDGGKEKPKC